MRLQGFFDHDSPCVLATNIGTTYPTQCDGAAACACMGPGSTPFGQRVSRFGVSATAEIIAGGTEPNTAFYQWLFESSPATACAYSSANGHRWSILKQTGAVGVGVSGPSVGDFSAGGGPVPARVPSGSHYPRQAATVEAWASWYDTFGPRGAQVVVDGACTPMTRERGDDSNGAWRAMVGDVGSGCHRYWFSFTAMDGSEVSYPTTGSLGIGPAGSCADWNMERPAKATNCDGASGGGDGGGADMGGGGNMPGGCACGIAQTGAPTGGLVALLGLLALLARRVRR
jgi:MYXO-CTERM domain-containing protein